MVTVWEMYVDFDDDNIFETGENLITSVTEMEWSLGMDPFSHIESETFARVVLDNRGGSLDTYITGGQFAAGKRLRIIGNDGVGGLLFSGYIHSVEQDGSGFLVLVCETALAQLNQDVNIALQVDVDVDDAIASVLDQCQLRYKNIAWTFFLDRSLLDSGSKLLAGVSGSEVVRDFDTAAANLSYVGDTYEGGVSALVAVRDLVEAEGGRFFTDRSGQFVFKNRSSLYVPGAAGTLLVGTGGAPVVDCRYQSGKYFVSHGEIEVTPRSVGSAGSVLWQLNHVMRFEANLTRQFRAVFRDSNDRKVGSVDSGYVTGFVFNTAQDGSGSNVTAAVSVQQEKRDASSVLLTIQNELPYEVYLLAGAQVIGTPLLRDDPVVVRDAAVYNSFQYVKRTERKTLPVLTSVVDAQNLVSFDVARRGQVFDFFDEIVATDEVSGPALSLNAYLFTAGGVNVVGLIAGAANRQYNITRENHRVVVVGGGWRHEVRFALEPTFENYFFQLDVSLLDGANVLAY